MSATGSQFFGRTRAFLTARGQNRGAEIQQVPSLKRSGQEEDILDGSPNSLVCQGLFQSISMSILVDAAVFFAQAYEEQRWRLFDAAG